MYLMLANMEPKYIFLPTDKAQTSLRCPDNRVQANIANPSNQDFVENF